MPADRAIELVNDFFNISKSESIPLDQISAYSSEKLEEKKKLDEEIKQANDVLQSKNINIEALNEHMQLSQELGKHGLSTKDIHKLLNLLLAAKEYKYDPGKIVAKLRSIKRLENKENRLKNSCEVISNKEAKYMAIIPLAELIWNLHIRKSEQQRYMVLPILLQRLM